MNPDRWQQIESLFHAVVERPESERDAILAGADQDIRQEVEALLAQENRNMALDNSLAPPCFPRALLAVP